MLPTVLLGLFALELALCIGVGIHLLGSADEAMARRGELALCIALYLLVARLVLVLASFVHASLRDTGRPKQSPIDALRMVGREYAATLLAFSVLIPLSFLLAPRLSRRAAPGRTVVLLVHGLLSNRGVWWLFGRRLRRHGLLVDSVALEPSFGDMDAFVGQLARRVDAIARAGAVRVILIGHSMGGLVARAYLARGDADAVVARLLTLASPHRGSLCAHYLLGANLRQMRPNSDWLRALPATLSVPVVALYSAHDNLVVPYEYGHCDGVSGERWLGLGHLSLLFDAAVHARVRRWIDEGDTMVAAPPRTVATKGDGAAPVKQAS